MASLLKKLRCDRFSLTAYFKPDIFDDKELRKEVRLPKGDIEFTGAAGSGKASSNEHAHMLLTLDATGGYLNMSFHPGNLEGDIEEPYLEDLVPWVGKFFKTAEVPVVMFGSFAFSRKDYAPMLSIGYPVLVDTPVLRGASVTGYEIVFAKGGSVDKALLTTTKENISISLRSADAVNLQVFDVHKTVRLFATYAEQLVSKRQDKEKGSNAKST